MASTYLQKKDEEALRLKQQQGATAGNAALGDASQQATSLADATKTTSAGGFTPSAQLQQAQQQVQQMQQQKPGAYQSAITPQLQAQFEAIMNRQPFQYDLGSDPMFQQASDLYVQQGRRAMQDAIGEAVGLTGGYGNSYAQGVGQAAYGNYLQQLGALAPQYQQQAYARWQQEGADMADRYNMLAAREESDYGRYQDALNNYWAEVDRAQQAENNLYNREYGEHMDKLAYAQQQAEFAQKQKEYDQSYAQQQAEWQQQLKEYDQNYAQQQAEWAQQQAEWQQYLKEYDQNYAQEQAEWQQQLKEYDQGVASENREYAYNLALMMLQGGQMPSADVLAAAGISDADAAAIRAMYAPKSSGGSSGGGGYKQDASGQEKKKESSDKKTAAIPTLQEYIKPSSTLAGANGLKPLDKKTAAGNLEAYKAKVQDAIRADYAAGKITDAEAIALSRKYLDITEDDLYRRTLTE